MHFNIKLYETSLEKVNGANVSKMSFLKENIKITTGVRFFIPRDQLTADRSTHANAFNGWLALRHSGFSRRVLIQSLVIGILPLHIGIHTTKGYTVLQVKSRETQIYMDKFVTYYFVVF